MKIQRTVRERNVACKKRDRRYFDPPGQSGHRGAAYFIIALESTQRELFIRVRGERELVKKHDFVFQYGIRHDTHTCTLFFLLREV